MLGSVLVVKTSKPRPDVGGADAEIKITIGLPTAERIRGIPPAPQLFGRSDRGASFRGFKDACPYGWWRLLGLGGDKRRRRGRRVRTGNMLRTARMCHG